MEIESICCPACKAGVHPMQTHPPFGVEEINEHLAAVTLRRDLD